MQPSAIPQRGTLHVVATPIGNLGDISARALEILRTVAAVCAEDTRHTRQLLAHFGIERPLLALHQHNEDAQAAQLVARLLRGDSLALVSDAGTPLVSDPGYRLVRAAREAGSSPAAPRISSAACITSGWRWSCTVGAAGRVVVDAQPPSSTAAASMAPSQRRSGRVGQCRLGLIGCDSPQRGVPGGTG